MAPAGYGPPGAGPVAGYGSQPGGFAQPPGTPPGMPAGYPPPGGGAGGGFNTPAGYGSHPGGPPAGPAGGFGGPGGPAPAAAFGSPGFGAAGPPVVIDVGKTNARKAVIGASVAGAVGLFAIGCAAFGAIDGGAGATVIALVIGLLFLILPLGLILRRDKIFRPQLLVFEPAGLRWHDPKGAPWLAPWSELAAVSISKHSPQQVGPESISDKLSGAAADKIVGERAHVRLDIYPADPTFAGRHPEMAHLWERQGVQNGYRLPLGGNVQFIPTIAAAMGRFAPHIYRGVNATEGFMGLS